MRTEAKVKLILKGLGLGALVGLDNGHTVLRMMAETKEEKVETISKILGQVDLNIMLQNDEIEFRFVSVFILIYIN